MSYGKWLLIPLYLSPSLLLSVYNANVFTIVNLVYYFRILFARFVHSFEWFDSINKKAASLTTYYFPNDDLQMSFQPLNFFKILIVIVLISIRILGRSLVNT